MHSRSLLKHNLVGLLILHSHPVEKKILVPLHTIKKNPVFLNNTLHVILEHYFSKISSNNLSQRLTTQHLTYYILLGTHCHLSHSIVVQRVLTETLPLVNLTLLQIAL